MSRISEVLKNKNKLEKVKRNRRKDEMTTIKQESAFKARLFEELKKIDILFEKDEVESVVVVIPDVFIAKFGAALYSEDLAEYDIRQVEGYANRFSISRRFISF